MHSGIIQAREFDDPPGLHEKTEYLLREWVNLYHSPAAGLDSTKAFSSFVAQVYITSVMRSWLCVSNTICRWTDTSSFIINEGVFEPLILACRKEYLQKGEY